MKKVIEYYCEFPTIARRPMWRIWHKLLIKYDKTVDVHFMNYGYANLNGEPKLELHPEDEHNRYCIQLYDHVVQKAKIRDKHVVEVGSGRGGGASYIARYHNPQSYIGVDICADTINFCNKYYKVPGLSFKKGKAEKIPIETKSQDVVVNVESARCYSNIKTFFNEANRILKDDGYFMFADMIEPHEVEDIRNKLLECGFTIESEANITPNVVKALNIDTPRREKMIAQKVPNFLRESFAQFAGTIGTERYDSFTNGKFDYRSFVLRKKQ
jgi:ubiquinone/menaquinone biosynthesis C-methylase UbiE